MVEVSLWSEGVGHSPKTIHPNITFSFKVKWLICAKSKIRRFTVELEEVSIADE